MEWREDEDEARTSLYEQDEYRLYIGNPLDDPNYAPNTGAVRAAYAADHYMVQVRGGHDELERAERFDRWLAAEKAKWQAQALRDAARYVGTGDAPVEIALGGADWVIDWLHVRADRIEKGSDDGR